MLVSTLITRVREALHDTNSSLYPASEVLHAYNRAAEETQQLLWMMGARLAVTRQVITGDGTNYQFTLPSGCLGIVPGTLRPRSPATATTNYTHGAEVELVDDTHPSFTVAPTTTGMPLWAKIDPTVNPLTIAFNVIITTGYYYDYAYYPALSTVTSGSEGTTNTPWEGRLDRVLSRAMELILRTGAEYVGEPRKEWLAEARAAASQLLGMNKHNSNALSPSIFRGGTWQR